MTPLEPKLLRAVLDHLGEDKIDESALRLIAADWWEENGEPLRAELIRVQIDLQDKKYHCSAFMYDCGESYAYGTNLACSQCQAHYAKTTREKELLSPPNDYDWFAPRGMFSGEVKWIFKRGFVEEIAISAEDFLNRREFLLSHHPIRTVVLSTIPSVRRTRTGKHHMGRHRASLLMNPRKWFDYSNPYEGPTPFRYYDDEWMAGDLLEKTFPGIQFAFLVHPPEDAQ